MGGLLITTVLVLIGSICDEAAVMMATIPDRFWRREFRGGALSEAHCLSHRCQGSISPLAQARLKSDQWPVPR